MDQLWSPFRAVTWWNIGIALGTISSYWVFTSSRPSKQITAAKIKADGGEPFLLRDNNERRLEYFVFGDAESRTVLLAIHGANTTGEKRKRRI